MQIELWEHPIRGKRVQRIPHDFGGVLGARQIYADAKGTPILDRFGRYILGETDDGCLYVAHDGYLVVTGKIAHGQLVINCYTGEVFRDGRRVRLPERGPKYGKALPLAN